MSEKPKHEQPKQIVLNLPSFKGCKTRIMRYAIYFWIALVFFLCGLGFGLLQ